MFKIEDRLACLTKLYRDIHSCSKCTSIGISGMGDDAKKVIRIAIPEALDSHIFAIGQALGENTQRLSGISYTFTNGRLSQSGRQLDRFLNLFGYTIEHNHRLSKLQYTYCSDIVQCYPGKLSPGHGDRKPESEASHLCLEQRYLIKEIRLVEPKLILLMGKSARDAIYKYILKRAFPQSLTEHMSMILDGGNMDALDLEGIHSYVMPIQHPSGANPRFASMIESEALKSLLGKVLK